METIKLTIRLPRKDVEFAKGYAKTHGMRSAMKVNMEVKQTAKALVVRGKGILAIDESFPSIKMQVARKGDVLCRNNEMADCRVVHKGFVSYLGSFVLSSR
jgi:hypothetical protein